MAATTRADEILPEAIHDRVQKHGTNEHNMLRGWVGVKVYESGRNGAVTVACMPVNTDRAYVTSLRPSSLIRWSRRSNSSEWDEFGRHQPQSF